MEAITIASIPRMQVAQLSAILRSGDGIFPIDGSSTTVTTKDDIITTTVTTKTTKDTTSKDTTSKMEETGPSKTITIIDVRDEDRIEGHIPTSRHVPSETFNEQLPGLVDDLRHDPVVVFHCALSQQRGPRAAMQYLKARRRRGLDRDDDDGERRQEVYILEGGYAAWQELS